MILGVFIEFFGVKIAVGLSKNRCDLFLTIGFDFGSNLTVGSSYIRYKSFWTVRSSFRFKINRWIKNIAVGFFKKRGRNLDRWIKNNKQSDGQDFLDFFSEKTVNKLIFSPKKLRFLPPSTRLPARASHA